MSADSPISPQGRKTRAPGELAFAIAALIFSAFLLSRLGDQTVWAKGQKFSAQPALWPAIAVGGMTLFSLLNLVAVFRRGAAPARGGEEALTWARSVEFALWFMAYVFVTPQLGYLPTTLAFAPLLALRVGYRSAPALLGAAAMGLVVVLLFKTLLQVRIPGGAVYEFLPDGVRNFFIVYL